MGEETVQTQEKVVDEVEGGGRSKEEEEAPRPPPPPAPAMEDSNNQAHKTPAVKAGDMAGCSRGAEQREGEDGQVTGGEVDSLTTSLKTMNIEPEVKETKPKKNAKINMSLLLEDMKEFIQEKKKSRLQPHSPSACQTQAHHRIYSEEDLRELKPLLVSLESFVREKERLVPHGLYNEENYNNMLHRQQHIVNIVQNLVQAGTIDNQPHYNENVGEPFSPGLKRGIEDEEDIYSATKYQRTHNEPSEHSENEALNTTQFMEAMLDILDGVNLEEFEQYFGPGSEADYSSPMPSPDFPEATSPHAMSLGSGPTSPSMSDCMSAGSNSPAQSMPSPSNYAGRENLYLEPNIPSPVPDGKIINIPHQYPPVPSPLNLPPSPILPVTYPHPARAQPAPAQPNMAGLGSNLKQCNPCPVHSHSFQHPSPGTGVHLVGVELSPQRPPEGAITQILEQPDIIRRQMEHLENLRQQPGLLKQQHDPPPATMTGTTYRNILPKPLPPHIPVSTHTQPDMVAEIMERLAKPEMIAARSNVAMMTEDFMKVDADGDSALHITVAKEDKCSLIAFLDRCVRANILQESINKKNNLTQTPLFIAALTEDPDIAGDLIVLLLYYKADPAIYTFIQDGNLEERTFVHPIHHIATKGNAYAGVMRKLLSLHREQQLSLTCSKRYTALHHAAVSHHRRPSDEVIMALLQNGANINAKEGRRGCTPLHLIIETCDVILLRQVLQFLSHDREGVRTAVNTARYDRETALHIAASQTMELHRHKTMLQLLLSHGADTSVKNGQNKRPCDLLKGSSRELIGLFRGPSAQHPRYM